MSSRIKPLLEVHLEARKHLFFNVFDIGELNPTSDIAVFTGTSNSAMNSSTLKRFEETNSRIEAGGEREFLSYLRERCF
ncbi:MAG TPA: hypothetical protein VIS96_10445 [Terrimicrobiaceae bacterium]